MRVFHNLYPGTMEQSNIQVPNANITQCYYIIKNKKKSPVLLMSDNLLPDPGCRRKQLSGCSLLNQLQILLNGAMRIGVYIHRSEVAINQRYQSRKAPLPIYNLIDRHQLILSVGVIVVLVGTIFVVVVVQLSVWLSLRDNRLRTSCSGNVFLEPEFFRQHSTPLLGGLHVLVYLADWNQEIKLVGKYYPGEQHYETHDGGILEVCELSFTGPEFNAPADG